jgi:hypothetical protein
MIRLQDAVSALLVAAREVEASTVDFMRAATSRTAPTTDPMRETATAAVDRSVLSAVYVVLLTKLRRIADNTDNTLQERDVEIVTNLRKDISRIGKLLSTSTASSESHSAFRRRVTFAEDDRLHDPPTEPEAVTFSVTRESEQSMLSVSADFGAVSTSPSPKKQYSGPSVSTPIHVFKSSAAVASSVLKARQETVAPSHNDGIDLGESLPSTTHSRLETLLAKITARGSVIKSQVPVTLPTSSYVERLQSVLKTEGCMEVLALAEISERDVCPSATTSMEGANSVAAYNTSFVRPSESVHNSTELTRVSRALFSEQVIESPRGRGPDNITEACPPSHATHQEQEVVQRSSGEIPPIDSASLCALSLSTVSSSFDDIDATGTNLQDRGACSLESQNGGDPRQSAPAESLSSDDSLPSSALALGVLRSAAVPVTASSIHASSSSAQSACPTSPPDSRTELSANGCSGSLQSHVVSPAMSAILGRSCAFIDDDNLAAESPQSRIPAYPANESVFDRDTGRDAAPQSASPVARRLFALTSDFDALSAAVHETMPQVQHILVTKTALPALRGAPRQTSSSPASAVLSELPATIRSAHSLLHVGKVAVDYGSIESSRSCATPCPSATCVTSDTVCANTDHRSGFDAVVFHSTSEVIQLGTTRSPSGVLPRLFPDRSGSTPERSGSEGIFEPTDVYLQRRGASMSVPAGPLSPDNAKRPGSGGRASGIAYRTRRATGVVLSPLSFSSENAHSGI